MNWLQLIRERILKNLFGAPISQEVKEEIVEQAISDTEAGRPFSAPEEEKPKATEDEPRVRGEKLSALRARARKFGGWEPWNS